MEDLVCHQFRFIFENIHIRIYRNATSKRERAEYA